MLTLAILGCGSRGRTYAALAARFPGQLQVVAAADPHPESLAVVSAAAGRPVATFGTGEELLRQPRAADVAVIATQDRHHAPLALAALGRGYHLLLEKPAGTTIEDARAIRDAARAADRRVVLCHVLRHTPFYQTVRGFLDSGRLGELVTIHASEGVEPWHQAHSFVRGHWSRTADSTPMILAKSCHDMDLIAWFAGRPCRRAASFGALSRFRPEHAPRDAAARCTDPCPLAGACMFDAHRYATDKRNWLRMLRPDADDLDAAQIHEWLRDSPWGRCVWRCDNDVVDQQVAAFEFEGGVTATFTMTAFDSGRRLALFGTGGVLRGGPGLTDGPGGAELWFHDHATGQTEAVPIETPDAAGYQGHGGGDYGLIRDLHDLIARPPAGEFARDDWFESHRMAFGAEQARLAGAVVDLA
jgi:predicted dehydrogenase